MSTAGLSTACLAALAAFGLAWASPAGARDKLEVCLDKNVPPLSSKRGQEAKGFDLYVASAVAQRLGRALAVQWFESELDNDGNPTDRMNALLSDGRCRLIAGYPLVASELGEPQAARSRLPDFEGAHPEDRRRWVPLGTLAATRGYRFDPLVVVLGPNMAGREIGSLGDLKGARIVVEERTLGDAILMSYSGGVLIGGITHIVPGGDPLAGLERGEYDAALVELHRLDAYRAEHPDTRLTSSGHYHSIGFNIGFAALASEAPLIAEVNAALGELLAKDELPALAREAGVTYLPPRQPEITATIAPADLRND